MRRLTLLVRDFNGNDRGAVGIVLGLSFLVLCLCMGLAYDSSRLNNVTTRVQSALDSAALAGAKLLDQDTSSDSDVENIARAFFDARRPEMVMNGLQVGIIQATLDRSQSSVSLRVNGSLSSLFGNLSGISPTLDFTRESKTIFKSKKVELSLVLDITGSMSNNGRIGGLKAAAKDLVDTLFATNPNPGAIRVSLVPYSASVNAGSYKEATTGIVGSLDDCVVERAGASSKTDEPPTAGKYLGVSDITINPAYSCPAVAVEPLTDLWQPSQRDSFKARIDALTANGGTAGQIGLAWGWYFLSPNWSYLWPQAQRPRPPSDDVIKAVILMTDGEFNTSYLPQNTNSSDYTAVDSSGDQALSLCEEMKKQGSDIKVFTIGFQAPSNAEAMLRSCSGTDNFFDANSTGDLISAFREIAERLTSLRLAS